MNACVVLIYITISSNGILFICSALVHQIGKAILLVMSFFFLSYILCNYLHKRKQTRTNSATPSINFQRQRILYLFPKDATAIGSCCAFCR